MNKERVARIEAGVAIFKLALFEGHCSEKAFEISKRVLDKEIQT
jgi:hypothetical protein